MPTRTCKHPGCNRPVNAKGHCRRHRIQFRERGETWDIGQQVGKASHRCQHEGCQVLARSTFCDEHRADLGLCQVLGCESLRRSLRVSYCDFHVRANRSFRHSYGITLRERDAMLVVQDFRCAICQQEKPLHLDHCHETGVVRGMICGNCNRGIGLLSHDPATLRTALAYLEGR